MVNSSDDGYDSLSCPESPRSESGYASIDEQHLPDVEQAPPSAPQTPRPVLPADGGETPGRKGSSGSPDGLLGFSDLEEGVWRPPQSPYCDLAEATSSEEEEAAGNIRVGSQCEQGQLVSAIRADRHGEETAVVAGRFCHSVLLDWPVKDQTLLTSILELWADPKTPDFPQTPSGQALQYLFDERLNPYHDITRPGSWSSQACRVMHTVDPGRHTSAQQVIKDRALEIGEMMYVLPRVMWSQFFSSLCKDIEDGRSEGLFLGEFGSSDAATFKLRMPSPNIKRHLLAITGPQSTQSQCKRKRAELIDASVMQSVLSVCAVWRNTLSGKIQSMHGPLPCLLQSADRNTSENMVPIQEELYANPGLTDRKRALFRFNGRAHCQDKCNSNEKQIVVARNRAEARPVPIRMLNTHCDVHRVSTIVTKTTDLVKFDVSGLIARAIAERSAGKLDEVRTVAVQRCIAKLRIHWTRC